MSLTLPSGPLSTDPTPTVNYTIDAPGNRLLFEPFPRRVRAMFAGAVVLDTVRGRLLHETAIAPVLYAPIADFAAELLEHSDTSTHCPYKGDASYRSVRVGDAVAVDAVWFYPDPIPSAPWLEGHAACYWDRVDAWFDEDEQVRGHLRDPYHRVDVRRASRHVVVTVGADVVAESGRAMVLSETGLANRWYLPVADVRTDLLTPSTTTSVCPYKGEASWWSHPDVADVAWSFERPLDDAARVAGHLAFAPTPAVTVTVDGRPAAV